EPLHTPTRAAHLALSEPCFSFRRRQAAFIPTIILARVASSAHRAFDEATIFSLTAGSTRPALICSVISWRLAGSAHRSRIEAAILARLLGLPMPTMSLLRFSGSAQRAFVSSRFLSRLAGSAQYSLAAARCFSLKPDHHKR